MTVRGTITIWAMLAGVALGSLAPQAAWPDDPLRSVEYRQQEIRKMASAMRVISRFLKDEGASVADVGASAETIHTIALELVRGLFPEGTAIGVGRSGARPEIWQQWDLFKEQATNLAVAAGRLTAAAAGGDAEAVRGPIRAVGQACAACHELFRQKVP